PELDVADTASAVALPVNVTPHVRDDRVGGHGGLALGEDARFGRADTRDVPDRIHARPPGLQCERVDGDPAIDGQPGTFDDGWSAMNRYPEEQVVRQLACVIEDRHVPLRVERPDRGPRHEVDPA